MSVSRIRWAATLAAAVVLTTTVVVPPASGTGQPARDMSDTCGTQTPAGYIDVTAGNVHRASIDCVSAYRVAKGLGNGNFGPWMNLTRGQTATFLRNALDLVGVPLPPPTGTCGDGIHTPNYERLQGATIIPASAGCADSGLINRSEMALWTRNALTAAGVPTGTSIDFFFDDVTDPNHQAINDIAALGIVVGNPDGTYTPTRPLPRAQMATFLGRALDAMIDQSTSATIDVFYVVPSGTTARPDVLAGIRTEVPLINGWFGTESGLAGLRFRMDGSELRITTVNLPVADADLNSPADVRAAMGAVGADPGGALMVYLEGSAGGGCGVTGSGMAVLAMPTCNISPSAATPAFPYGATYLGAHELTHLLGAAPECAPSLTSGGHVGDSSSDILYRIGTPNFIDLHLDVNRDDYYRHANPECFDIDDNVHWDR